MKSQQAQLARLRVGDRVRLRGPKPLRRGTIDRISVEGIHYLVKFDDGMAPDWPQVVNGGCFFYRHELITEPRA